MMVPEQLVPYSEVIFRLFLATLLGGLIGVEREKASWFAGLRTHILVCIGSTLIMIVSQYGFQQVIQKELIVLDPSRVAAQVVSGIGFLGAGTILFWKNKIRGLTTAASLWTVAGVGLAIGGGLYFAAISTTVLILLVLVILKPLEKHLFKKYEVKEIKFLVKSGTSLSKLDQVLDLLNLRSLIKNLSIQNEGEKELVHFIFNYTTEVDLLKLMEEIKKIPGVDKVEVREESLSTKMEA